MRGTLVCASFATLISLTAARASDDPPAGARPAPPITVAGVEFQFVRIPPGEFVMGSDQESETPRHRVRVRAFDLATTEVTVRQFRAFTEATGYRTDAEKEGDTWTCRWSADDNVPWRSRGFWNTQAGANWRNPGFTQSDEHPVVAISWQDAVEFSKWLSRESGQEFRLPTEAEWEYAARAGNQAEQPAELAAEGWYKVNSGGHTHPVGQKKPNAWGLYDMLGNAWEWVADIWSKDYTGAPADGTARMDVGTAMGPFKAGEVRLLRGGAWCLESATARFASRPPFGLHQRCNNSGFRVARTVAAPALPAR